MAVDYLGMGVRVKFGDSMLNSGRIIRLFRRANPIYPLLFVSLTESSYQRHFWHIWGGGQIVPDKHLKFRDPCLTRPREIPPEAVGGRIFDSFFAITSDWK